jgi:hypothetical protein
MANDIHLRQDAGDGANDVRLRQEGADAGAGYTLTCDAGSYTITGQDATLLKTRIVVADAGAYTISGQDASVLVTHLLTADAGSYTISGQTASVLVGHVVTADPGAYSVAGQDAALTYTPAGGYTLTCDAGSYVISGQDAAFTLESGLIGRKYPRRGRSRPRKILETPEIVEIVEAIPMVDEYQEKLSHELAFAKAELVTTRLMAHNAVNNAGKILALSEKIGVIESNLRRAKEEERVMLALLEVVLDDI